MINRHYKFSRGLLSHEEVDRMLGKMVVIPSIAKAIRRYFVDGTPMKELNVNSSLMISYTREAYEHHLTSSVDEHRQRFLYTHDYNPRMRGVL
jgi:hypothetical protein